MPRHKSASRWFTFRPDGVEPPEDETAAGGEYQNLHLGLVRVGGTYEVPAELVKFFRDAPDWEETSAPPSDDDAGDGGKE